MKKNKLAFVREGTIVYKAVNTITIPVEVFETAESKEEIEDWLLAHDTEFIKRMKKAKSDMISGRGKTLEEIKKNLCIE